jgi:two-component system, OmpR family, KDP operon response regulator KdpE
MPNPVALIIEDEPQMSRLLKLALEAKGYTVEHAATGQLGLQAAAFRHPRVVVLDMGLPDIPGLEVLRRLREWSDAPVLILSVLDQEQLKVAALEAGADDYVTKPFGTAELLARLAVIQRRQSQRESVEITVGALTLNLLHHEATVAGEALKLTPTEFLLAKTLAEHPGRILTQSQILRKVWPGQATDSHEGLRVHINHLRKKLSAAEIKIVNEPGVGYRLTTAGGGV